MLTFEAFTGINNVLPTHRLKKTDLAVATNVDVGLSGEMRRRSGYTRPIELGMSSLWQAKSFLLAVSAGNLVRIDGVSTVPLRVGMGTARVWYVNFPDGRTGYSNGTLSGIVNAAGTASAAWGAAPITTRYESDGVTPNAARNLSPMPVGTVMAAYHGRIIVAQGKILWASSPFSYELCDLRFDYKMFSDDITMIQPVDDGIYVGTQSELAFLAGATWDELAYRQVTTGRTVLGSGVTVEAEYLKPREGGNNRGTAMVCIADGGIVYGYNGGSIWRVTEGRYRTEVTEVAATWRLLDGVPQYIAVPQ